MSRLLFLVSHLNHKYINKLKAHSYSHTPCQSFKYWCNCYGGFEAPKLVFRTAVHFPDLYYKKAPNATTKVKRWQRVQSGFTSLQVDFHSHNEMNLNQKTFSCWKETWRKEINLHGPKYLPRAREELECADVKAASSSIRSQSLSFQSLNNDLLN